MFGGVSTLHTGWRLSFQKFVLWPAVSPASVSTDEIPLDTLVYIKRNSSAEVLMTPTSFQDRTFVTKMWIFILKQAAQLIFASDILLVWGLKLHTFMGLVLSRHTIRGAEETLARISVTQCEHNWISASGWKCLLTASFRWILTAHQTHHENAASTSATCPQNSAPNKAVPLKYI